jgi:hypothetical protein
MRAPYIRARIFFMWNYKKVIMLVLVCFGPLGFFYFLSKGEYHFTALPYLYDENNHTPKSYEHFEVVDQDGKVLTQDFFKNKFTVINYMDKTCPYDCKIDAKMMRLVVYKELMGALGFSDVVMITEVNDSVPEHRKMIQDLLGVDGNKWKFVYSKHFDFFDIVLNGTNPYITKSSDLDARPFFNMTMKLIRGLSREVDMKEKDRQKLNEYFEENIYQRSILILDKSLRIRSYLNSSESIEFKRVMEELRLLKKEYSKNDKIFK